MTSEEPDIEELKELKDEATKTGVAKQYLEDAEVIDKKMSGNLQARTIFEKLRDYPIREYPEPEPEEPKKGGRGAPPKQDKKKKKKKRKKKEKPFPVPEWAADIEVVEATVKEMNTLLGE